MKDEPRIHWLLVVAMHKTFSGAPAKKKNKKWWHELN
jgi:hypothetical protein